MLVDLESRFYDLFHVANVGEIAAIAAVTHPKFKNRWLGCLSPQLQERVREKVLEALNQFSNATPQHSEPLTREEEDYFDFGL